MRKVLKKTMSVVLAASLLAGSVGAVDAAEMKNKSARRGNADYVSNQGELITTPFVQLPVGAVRANGWLENQLLLQKVNLTGNMHLFNDYNEATSAWLGAENGESWERGPYYMRGLVALAYVLDDEELKTEAQMWVEAILASQKEDGSFGAGSKTDWWAKMPVLMAMRDYYEATEAAGKTDERVIPFMESYFRYQAAALPNNHLSNWADARGGDNIDSVYWLYNRLYNDSDPQSSDWLLDLGNILEEQTTDWTGQYNDTTVRQHVVNTSQGMKTPAVYYQYSKNDRDKNALQNGLLNMSIDHGRVDGLPNSDEAARDNRSTRGTENCGIVEGLLSSEIAEKVLGEAWIGDRIEKLAYNALPAAYTPDMSGHVYYVLQNQVMATLGNHEFDCDHGDSSAFGAPLGFDCCYSNTHMGWPKFVQNMWMASENNGLALTAYGPNQVTAKVADGKTAEFVQQTDYPFKDAIHLDYKGDTADFELQLRIPEWAVDPVVKVNDTVVQGVVNGEYYKVDREWKKGDTIDLVFPSEIATSSWYNDSVAVEKGPLLYGLKIEEDWRVEKSNDARELKVEHQEQSPLREVYPASQWNYGLVVEDGFEVSYADEVALQPFSTQTAPVTIKATGQLIPEWTYDGNIAGPQPFGATPADESLQTDIELIPYGSGRLRISQFPAIGEPYTDVVKAEGDSSKIKHLGNIYQEFKNIIVPAAQNYTLTVEGSGQGEVIVNNKGKVSVDLTLGSATLEGLKTLISDGNFKFTNGHFNNLRFTEGLQVDRLVVTPVNMEITDINIESYSRTDDYIKINTNLNAQETPYELLYKTTEEGDFTNSIIGFESQTAYITGIDPTLDYYVQIVAKVHGEDKASDVIVLKAEEVNGGGLKPNPGAPNAQYTGFTTLNYMEDGSAGWVKYDPGNNIRYIQDENEGRTVAKIGKNERVKMTYEPADGSAQNWTDYVVTGTVSVDEMSKNNAGIIFRGSNFGNDPDAYAGYFAGIGRVDYNDGNVHGLGLMIGYADGQWHDIKGFSMPELQTNTKYDIKVVAFGDQFAVYLKAHDDADYEFIAKFSDSRFSKGTIGFRSYNEAFTAYGVDVRPVVQEDLGVFEETEEEPGEQPNEVLFTDDFSDAQKSQENWLKVPNQADIQFVDEKVVLGSSTDMKLVTAEPYQWKDFVYEADVTLRGEGQNAGLIFRSSKEESGADSYNGYYFGIGYGKGKGSFEVGKATDKKWNGISGTVESELVKPDQAHHLMVIAYGSKLNFFIDGTKVYSIADSSHKIGRVGLRGYNRQFEVDNIQVRTLTEEEKEIYSKIEVEEFDITAESFQDGFQITYPKTTAASYKVQYGTEPGVYTNEFVDVKFNNYKGGGVFTKDKVAFGVPFDGTYYFRLVGLSSGQIVVAQSNELMMDTGYLEDTSANAQRLDDTKLQVSGTDTSKARPADHARLKTAIADAGALQEATGNQMDYDLASSLLTISKYAIDNRVAEPTDPEEPDETEPEETEKPQETEKPVGPVKPVEPSKPVKKNQRISAKNISKIYGTKPFKLNVKTNGDGKLSYKSDNKKVVTISSSGKVTVKNYGKAKITIKASATGKYNEAFKTITFEVRPKKAVISKVSAAGKGRMKVTWKKDSRVTGYQIVYARNSKFTKGKKYVSVKNAKTITKTVSKLKKGTKYFVKVRSYKTVKNHKYYSSYSKVKSVRIK